MKRLAMVLVMVFVGSVVQAGIVTDKYDLADDITELKQFNPAVGTLTAVELDFKDVNIQSGLVGPVVEVDGTGFELLQNRVHIVAPGILDTKSLNSFVFEFSVNGVEQTVDFGLPTSFTLTPAVLAPYIGVGTVPFGLTSLPKVLLDFFGPGIDPPGDLDKITGCLTVKYTYNEGTLTPEPPTYALACLGVLIVLGYRYRRTSVPATGPRTV